MRRIWAPWRIKYIEIAKEESRKECFLCEFPRQDKEKDKENKILLRATKSFIIMNSFPYNPGHLMVAPYRHVSEIGELTREEILEMWDLIKVAIQVIEKEMSPDGFNIGINIGRAAGAGLEDHIHIHVVPRWNGDTNFMPVLADVKVIPEALEETYDKLKSKLDQLKKERKDNHE
ncbi:HIT family hydrolase [Thermococci archaeon]|nr:MAG: HIT family hydrolase [Thermococci archaeon]RLF96957.1 MAG: HIT family hydrolase [Thermococci archaeon]